MNEEEYAIGVQYQCAECKKNKKTAAKESVPDDGPEGQTYGPHCLATTNPMFWAKKQYWEIPGELNSPTASGSFSIRLPLADIPHFLKKAAVTRELYNEMIEMKMSVPSGRMAKHIKRRSTSLLHAVAGIDFLILRIELHLL